MTTLLRSDKCLQQSIDDHLVKQAGRCDHDDDGHLVEEAGQTVGFSGNYGQQRGKLRKQAWKSIRRCSLYIALYFKKNDLQFAINETLPSLVICHNHF